MWHTSFASPEPWRTGDCDCDGNFCFSPKSSPLLLGTQERFPSLLCFSLAGPHGYFRPEGGGQKGLRDPSYNIDWLMQQPVGLEQVVGV